MGTLLKFVSIVSLFDKKYFLFQSRLSFNDFYNDKEDKKTHSVKWRYKPYYKNIAAVYKYPIIYEYLHVDVYEYLYITIFIVPNLCMYVEPEQFQRALRHKVVFLSKNT